MKEELLLASLEEAAEKLGIGLRYDDLRKGAVNTNGGRYTLHGEDFILIHKGLKTPERVDILSDLISTFDTSSVFLPPEARELIDKAAQARMTREEKKALSEKSA